ncbi:MAG: DedA family protein [Rectinemataceae bacterium]
MSDIAMLAGPWIGGHPLLSAFLFLVLFGFTTPIPEELALVLVGLTLREARVPYLAALAAAFSALLLADLAYYSAARFLGPRLLRFRLLRGLLKPRGIAEAERYFSRKGARIVFACRFVVGLRAAAILSSGFLRLAVRRFVAYDASALSIGSVAWLAVGYAVGSRLGGRIGSFERIFSIIAPAAVVTAAILVYLAIKADRSKTLAKHFERSAAAAVGPTAC